MHLTPIVDLESPAKSWLAVRRPKFSAPSIAKPEQTKKYYHPTKGGARATERMEDKLRESVCTACVGQGYQTNNPCLGGKQQTTKHPWSGLAGEIIRLRKKRVRPERDQTS